MQSNTHLTIPAIDNSASLHACVHAFFASLLASSFAFTLLLSATGLQVAHAGELDPQLAATAKLMPQGFSKVLVQLDGEKPISTYAATLQSLPRKQRPGKLKSLLVADYQAALSKISPKYAALNAKELQALWLTHSVLLELPRNQLTALAALPGVKRVEADLSLRSAQRSGITTRPAQKERAAAEAAEAAAAIAKGAPVLNAQAVPKSAAPAKPLQPASDAIARGVPLTLPPHFLALDVPAAWQAGARGKGATVAIVDSGVDIRSTAIAQGFRGSVTDWFDPYGERAVPTDHEGHGTYVAGLLVGDVVSSKANNGEPVESVPVGVAPDSKWIAARIFDDGGHGNISAIQRIYQWLLDPDGKPDTADAPDIVNNSWGLPQTAGRCDSTMARAIEALRAADISVVFAAGNDGPADNTSLSPANNAGVISVGALRANREASRRSSRGPSACTKDAYPTLWTAGEQLPALDRMAAAAGATGQADGSSFAAAAISGSLAMLRSAAPDASAETLEAALIKSTPASNAANAANYASPQLAAALAQVTGKAVPAPAPLKLRAQLSAASGEALKLNATTLASLLPWEEKVSTVAGEGVQSSGAGEWEVKAATANKPVQLAVKTASGREFSVELSSTVETVARSNIAKREPLKTAMNQALTFNLSVSGAAVPKQGVRLSSPVRGGRAKLLDNGQVEYTPPKNFVGADQFTYALPQPDGKPGVTTIVTVIVQR